MIKPIRINPQKMAELYKSMLKGRAVREVEAIIRQYESSPETVHYWLVVKAFLHGHDRTKGKH